MTPTELARKCRESIERTNSGEPMITLQVRAGKSPSRKTRYLAGAGSPKGKIVAWGMNGYDTCFFNAREVLDFMIEKRIVDK